MSLLGDAGRKEALMQAFLQTAFRNIYKVARNKFDNVASNFENNTTDEP